MMSGSEYSMLLTLCVLLNKSRSLHVSSSLMRKGHQSFRKKLSQLAPIRILKVTMMCYFTEKTDMRTIMHR